MLKQQIFNLHFISMYFFNSLAFPVCKCVELTLWFSYNRHNPYWLYNLNFDKNVEFCPIKFLIFQGNLVLISLLNLFAHFSDTCLHLIITRKEKLEEVHKHELIQGSRNCVKFYRAWEERYALLLMIWFVNASYFCGRCGFLRLMWNSHQLQACFVIICSFFCRQFLFIQAELCEMR